MHFPTPPKQAPPSEGRRAPPRSLLRYSSTEGGSNNGIPTVTASPSALPTINNRILQHQADQFQVLQQQMLLEHMLSAQRQCSCATAADTISEDDAPLPADRYSHMSDTLLPDRDPQTFEAWKAEMETKLQQRLQQPRPSAHTALAQDS